MRMIAFCVALIFGAAATVPVICKWVAKKHEAKMDKALFALECEIAARLLKQGDPVLKVCDAVDLSPDEVELLKAN